MPKTVDKKTLAKRLQKKMGCALKRRLLWDAVLAISSKMEEKLICDQAISVEHFGTLSPYIFHSHNGINIASGQIERIDSFRTVKFHPHTTLSFLLSQRRENFLCPKASRVTKRKKR